MLDIGWSEMMVIAVVALVVIGPKELPGVLRGLGRSVTKLRKMAGEFRAQFDEAIREADLQDLKDSADSLRSTMGGLKSGLSPLNTIRNEMMSAGEAVTKPVAASTPVPAGPTPAIASVAAALPTPAPAVEPLVVNAEAEAKTAAKTPAGKKANANKVARKAEPAASSSKTPVKPAKAIAAARVNGKGHATAAPVGPATSKSAGSKTTASKAAAPGTAAPGTAAPKTAVKTAPPIASAKKPTRAKARVEA
jgi:sec-independent protein translocase protein TatB